jgi:hypothetical protein
LAKPAGKLYQNKTGVNTVKSRISKRNFVLIKLRNFLSIIEIRTFGWLLGLLKFRNSWDILFYFERFF